MKIRVSILFTAFLFSLCAPVFATPATDAIEADQDFVDRVTNARQQEVDEQLKKFQEKMMKLPDNKRDRFGALGEGEVLVEKASNMRMRLDKSKINEKGKIVDIAEYRFIENGKVYGFYGGRLKDCEEIDFTVLKSSESWIVFRESCLYGSLTAKDRSVYGWMLYDRKYHKLFNLYSLFGPDEYRIVSNKYPWVAIYNNGKYALYYPHLKDTMYLDVKKPGNGGCHWKSDKKITNDDDDMTGNECFVSPHDLIEDGVPKKH